MAIIYKALSALLSYPTMELKQAAEEIRAALHEDCVIPEWLLGRLDRLICEIETIDLMELQERYVFLFDRTRSLSLHLFEHVHGESRDRGQAMVDLRALYEQSGFVPHERELPDFLPMFLEYLSLRPDDEARMLLTEPLAVIAALRERLSRRKSSYAWVMRSLEAISEGEPASRDLDALRKAPDDDPSDFDALDAQWEDPAVTFGPGDQDCSRSPGAEARR